MEYTPMLKGGGGAENKYDFGVRFQNMKGGFTVKGGAKFSEKARFLRLPCFSANVIFLWHHCC